MGALHRVEAGRRDEVTLHISFRPRVRMERFEPAESGGGSPHIALKKLDRDRWLSDLASSVRRGY